MGTVKSHSSVPPEPNVSGRLPALWNKIAGLVSGEHLLEEQANGGGVIVVRALRVSIVLWLVGMVFEHAFNPRSWKLNSSEFGLEFVSSLPMFGALFAAVYAALYARFASHWGYVADVYNQIRAAEIRADMTCPGVRQMFGHWKAGFIDDTRKLHLTTRPSITSIILAWSEIPEVRTAFIEDSPGRAAVFGEILRRARTAQDRAEERRAAHGRVEERYKPDLDRPLDEITAREPAPELVHALNSYNTPLRDRVFIALSTVVLAAAIWKLQHLTGWLAYFLDYAIVTILVSLFILLFYTNMVHGLAKPKEWPAPSWLITALGAMYSLGALTIVLSIAT